MSATKILWGQVTLVFAIVLVTVWVATQWTAWRLGYQAQLGAPWFELAGVPVPKNNVPSAMHLMRHFPNRTRLDTSRPSPSWKNE